MTNFKKGETVFYVGGWNEYTTVITEAVVYSCGKKQMVLTCKKSGKEMGRHFNPNGQDCWTGEVTLAGTYTTRAAAEAAAMTASETKLANALKRSEQSVAEDIARNVNYLPRRKELEILRNAKPTVQDRIY